MARTEKDMSKLDFEQVIKSNNVDEIASTMTTGFVQGKVGHAIEVEVVSATVENFNYYDGATLLMTIQVTYQDATKASISRAERTV